MNDEDKLVWPKYRIVYRSRNNEWHYEELPKGEVHNYLESIMYAAQEWGYRGIEHEILDVAPKSVYEETIKDLELKISVSAQNLERYKKEKEMHYDS